MITLTVFCASAALTSEWLEHNVPPKENNTRERENIEVLVASSEVLEPEHGAAVGDSWR